MGNIEILSSDDFRDNPQLKDKLSRLNEIYKDSDLQYRLFEGFFTFVMKFGGMRKDVFDFISESNFFDYGNYESLNYCTDLVASGADPEWYQLLKRTYIEKKTPSYMYNEIIAAMKQKVPYKVLEELFEICNDTVHMKMAIEEALKKMGIEDDNVRLVNKAFEEVSKITSVLDTDCESYRINNLKITEAIEKQSHYMEEINKKNKTITQGNEMMHGQFYELREKYNATIKENIELKKQLNTVNSDLSKIKSKTDYFEKRYENAQKTLTELAYKNTSLESTIIQLKKELDKQKDVGVNNSGILVELVKQSIEENKELKNQMAQLKDAIPIEKIVSEITKTIDSSQILNQQKVNNQENKTIKEEDSIISVDDMVETLNDSSNHLDHEVKGDELDGILEEDEIADVYYNTSPDNIHDSVDDEYFQQKELNEMPGTHSITDEFFKSEILNKNEQIVTNNRDGTIKRCNMFTSLYFKFQLRRFRNLDKKQQETIIFSKLMSLKFDKERIRYVKKAIENGANYEYLYILIGHQPTIKELKDYCEFVKLDGNMETEPILV